MENLLAHIEAMIFMSSRPISSAQLATRCEVREAEVLAVLEQIRVARNVDASGIHLMTSEDGVLFATNPLCAETIAKMSQDDLDTELTRPSLETLTIIAYRGPMTKPEIEAIRGVNCTLILRNLMMRGLVDEQEDSRKMQTVYSVSMDALRFLGVHGVSELPEYDVLHGNTKIDTLLASLSSSEPL